MIGYRIFLETGKKKTFASALDWSGWCRGGRDGNDALRALMEYAPRFGEVLNLKGLEFQPPLGMDNFQVVEQQTGDATTDFGAPGMIAQADREPVTHQDFERFRMILEACWLAFDGAVAMAAGKTLRVGPRGGGRDLGRIVEHVIEADKAYLGRVGWKKKNPTGSQAEVLYLTRRAIHEALEIAEAEGFPEIGPRGGLIWPVRFFVRRVAWHVLDHTWEIEDRGE